jgi:phenylpyruvate tautomerase PptA (4-oxalocrotonate tautomerase family)
VGDGTGLPTVCAMPILEVHLVEGMHTPAQHAELLAVMSTRYAELLGSPLAAVRAWITLHRPELWATAGVPTSGRSAPYFTAMVLEGRPVEQRRRLLGDFTDIIVDVLGVDRRLVHGRIIPVHPDDWAIGGVPAGAARRGDPRARFATSG